MNGWADIVWLDDRNWQFTVGYKGRDKKNIVFESRSNISTEYNAVTAMEAAYQRMTSCMVEIEG